jgi:hypothetical protein
MLQLVSNKDRSYVASPWVSRGAASSTVEERRFSAA